MCETQGLVYVRLQLFEGLDGVMKCSHLSCFLVLTALTEGLSSEQTYKAKPGAC